MKADPKTYLWGHICKLMGEENPSFRKVQITTKVGHGTAQRIEKGETSIGIDNLVKIAAAFRIEAWQLLTPDLGGSLLKGVASVAPTTQAQQLAMYFDRIKDPTQKNLIYTKFLEMIMDAANVGQGEPPHTPGQSDEP